MPGSYSRNKGRRLEQELVNLLKAAKIPAQRISMVETGHFLKGDLLVQHKWKAEVKGGDQVPKFLYTAMKDGEEILFMRRDREKWLVCMDIDWFTENLLENSKDIDEIFDEDERN